MTAPQDTPPRERPPYVADLVLAQQPEELNPTRRTLFARQLYFTEMRIVDPGTEPPLVQVYLSDILRRFWAGYGSITKRWNIPVPAEPGVVEIGNGVVRENSSGRRYDAGTAHNGGLDPVPLREIVAELLAALPGALRILRWPTAALVNRAPPEVRCWGASPQEVLREVLAAYGPTLDIGADLRARVFAAGEGLIGEKANELDEDNLFAYDPETGAGAGLGEVVEEGNRFVRRPTGAPSELEIIGDRTVYDVTVDFLTPVLLLEPGPEPASLDSAAIQPLTPPRPPRRAAVVEMTPTNLAALAAGELDPARIAAFRPVYSDGSAADSIAIASALGAALVPVPIDVSLVGARTLPAAFFGGVAARPGPPDPLVWQRLPFADDRTWDQSLKWVAGSVFGPLRRKIWRYYQVPRRLRRLLPLLNRATRDYRGKRLAPLVEAYSFGQARTTRDRQPPPGQVAAAVAARAGAAAARKLRVANLESVRGEIQKTEQDIVRLTIPTLPEVVAATGGVGAFFALDTAAAPRRTNPTGATHDETVREAEDGRRTVDAMSRLGREYLEKGKIASDALKAKLPQSLAFLVDAFTHEDLIRLAVPKSLTQPGPTQSEATAAVEELQGRLKVLREQEEKLLADLDPGHALVRALGALEAEIRNASQGGRRPPEALTIKAANLRREIEAARTTAAAQKATPDPTSTDRGQEEVLYQVNLPRRPVDYRVVDAELGVIEILGDLPGWVGDPLAADLACTYFVPMPVRITFGSFNGANSEPEETAVPVNPYTTAIQETFKALPDLAPALGTLGDRVPATVGEEQIRFTFLRGEPHDGRAVVSSRPWRAVFDADPPFRLLVRQGADNYNELLSRALPFAQALLAQPLSAPAGSLVVQSVRDPVCNGVVSAVEVRLLDPGRGFVTEESFETDAAPLPGFDGRLREPGPTRLVFGLDIERSRDE